MIEQHFSRSYFLHDVISQNLNVKHDKAVAN